MKRSLTILCLTMSPLLGCASEPAPPAAAASSGAESTTQRSATAALAGAPGVSLTGTGEFTSTPDGVRARVQIENATPGKHGIHVHEKGDCSDIPGKSMGSHFAPDHNGHGLLSSADRHLGDLGNVEIDADGKGTVDVTVKTATLDAIGPRSYISKALVIHEKEDVGTGDSGESGTPIACGIIRAD